MKTKLYLCAFALLIGFGCTKETPYIVDHRFTVDFTENYQNPHGSLDGKSLSIPISNVLVHKDATIKVWAFPGTAQNSLTNLATISLYVDGNLVLIQSIQNNPRMRDSVLINYTVK